jgi:hypothetical protein
MITKHSTPGCDLLRTGFYAPARAEELKCPFVELRVLWSIEDVTAKVVADTDKLPPAEQFLARRRTILALEKDSQDATGLDSSVVTLFGGARYHLYRSRRYTDVRLVFAPEESTAFFGGDVDNFEYPRFDHDFAFFRVYDDHGKPLHPEHYLRVPPMRSGGGGGASENELLFVFGHPGRTERLQTVDHVIYDRDVALPGRLRSLWRSEVKLQSFRQRGRDNARIARDDLFGAANSRKARTATLAALLDPRFLDRKREIERELRAVVDHDPQLRSRYADAWPMMAAACKNLREFERRGDVLERFEGWSCELAGFGRTIVQLVHEKTKPNSERLPEYGDASLDSLLTDLYSPAPIESALEIERLTSALSYAAEQLGADDPLVGQLLQGQSPQRRAIAMVRGTRLADVAFRKQLVEGGVSAVETSDDPIIRFSRSLDPEVRAVRKRYENEFEAVERDAYTKIAAAQFAAKGEDSDLYPDATGTLRIAFGTVCGYSEDDGRDVRPFTDYAGLYRHWRDRDGPAQREPPFYLTPRWVRAEKPLDLRTPLNFVLTADITGGNSGSPVINRNGEIVGIIFDSNIQGISNDYAYDQTQGRAVAVDIRAIVTALRDVYEAKSLLDELLAPDGRTNSARLP